MNALQKILQSKWLERTRRRVGKATGLHLRLKRFSASASEPLRTAMLLKEMNIQQVIDIGANTGQFAESLYDFDYKGKVVSFEPVGSAHRLLQKRSAPYPNWVVAPPCAIGNYNGEIEIKVSDDSVFSSALKIKDSYVAHNPKSRAIRSERVPIYRIDDATEQYIDIKKGDILLKIDTQGFEKQVLEGAQKLLPHVKGIKIEIPLYPIYEGSDFAFYEITDFMKANSFQPYSFHVEGVDLNTGRVNTIDGLFFRT